MMLMLAVLALVVADPPPANETADVDGLQQVYDQSCAAREYGAFDDLCDQLSHRLHEARVEADREARRKRARHGAAVPAASLKPPTTVIQPAAVAPPAAATPSSPGARSPGD